VGTLVINRVKLTSFNTFKVRKCNWHSSRVSRQCAQFNKTQLDSQYLNF
jgi:hypothetical protein